MERIKLVALFIFTSLCANAQISSPGLGHTKTASWSALGLQEQINEKNSSLTYIGFGSISGEGSSDIYNKPSIFVVNEEISHRISAHWLYSYALSYRRQHEYSYTAPYEAEDPEIQQEFRAYGRISYTMKFNTLKWKNTLRQETRKFYTPDFAEVENGLQLRTRVKTQLTLPIDNDAENKISGTAEALFAISNDSHTGWGDYDYKESRFCLYYTYAPHEIPVIFDLGYMNDLIGYGNDITDASYLAFDIILQDLF